MVAKPPMTLITPTAGRSEIMRRDFMGGTQRRYWSVASIVGQATQFEPSWVLLVDHDDRSFRNVLRIHVERLGDIAAAGDGENTSASYANHIKPGLRIESANAQVS